MDYNLQKNQNAEQTYHSIRNSIVSAQHRLSTAVNSAMVTTYWEIGELMRINDEQERRFYMEECAKAAQSVRQLERQINTMYYQRILASQDKNG